MYSGVELRKPQEHHLGPILLILGGAPRAAADSTAERALFPYLRLRHRRVPAESQGSLTIPRQSRTGRGARPVGGAARYLLLTQGAQ